MHRCDVFYQPRIRANETELEPSGEDGLRPDFAKTDPRSVMSYPAFRRYPAASESASTSYVAARAS